MDRGNPQRPGADGVSGIADDQRPVRREAGDATPVLQRPRVAERDDGRDAVSYRRGRLLDGAVREGGALAVPAGHDDGGRARGGRGGEEGAHLGYAGRRGAAPVEVSARQAQVVDPLRGDVGGAEDELEGV